MLASGGGTNDRTIRFWSSANGSCQRTVDAGAQVCALQWAKHDKELVSSLGYSCAPPLRHRPPLACPRHPSTRPPDRYNEIVIWKYPSLVKVAELRGHTRRVLHMAASPDGTTIVTAAADETLRFWKCFQKNDDKKSKVAANETQQLRKAQPYMK